MSKEEEQTSKNASTIPTTDETSAVAESSAKLEKSPKRGKRSWKKILLRTLFWVLISPLILLLFGVVLLYIPPIQDTVVSAVEKEVNKGGDVKLSIGTLRLGFPLKIKLQETTLVNAKGDTLLKAEQLSLRVALIPLLSGIVESEKIAAKGLSFSLPNEDNTSLTALSAKQIDIGPLSANLQREELHIGSLALREGNFLLSSRDTTVQEKSEPFAWHLSVSKVALEDFTVELDMPYDSLLIKAPMHQFRAEKLSVAVDTLSISADWLCVVASEAYYANDREQPEEGSIDYSRIYADELTFEAKSFLLAEGLLAFDVQSMKVKEQCGAVVEDLRGAFELASNVITVGDLAFLSPRSQIQGDLRLPLEIFKGNETEKIVASLRGDLALEDFTYFSGVELAPSAPSGKVALEKLSEVPLKLDINLEGPASKIELRSLVLERKNFFDFSLKGHVNYPFDAKKLALSATIDSRLQPELETLFPLFSPSLAEQLAIPRNTALKGDVQMRGKRYNADLLLSAPLSGNLHIQGVYSQSRQSYQMAVRSHKLRVDHFLPQDSIGETSFLLLADGAGFDLFDAKTHHQVQFELEDLTYKGYHYTDVALDGHLKEKQYTLDLVSHVPDAMLDLAVEGQVGDSTMVGELQTNIENLNLSNLGFTQDTIRISTKLGASFTSDLKQNHLLALATDTLSFHTPSLVFDYDKIALDLKARTDATNLSLASGDLSLEVLLHEGIDSIGSMVNKVNTALGVVLKDTLSGANLDFLLGVLPQATVDFAMARENPLTPILREQGLAIGETSLHLATQPETKNFNLGLLARNIRKDTLQIDSVSLHLYRAFATTRENTQWASIASNFIWQGTQPQFSSIPQAENSDMVLRLEAILGKKAYRNQPPIDILLRAETDLESLELDALYKERGETLHKLGAYAFRNSQGYGISLKPETILVMGKPLEPNPRNAIFYKTKEKSVKANLLLETEGKGSIELKSIEEEGEDGDRINLLIKNFQLALLNGLVGIDRMAGNTFADVMLEEDPTTQKLRVIGDLSVNDFAYDGSRLGHVSTALFYEPMDKQHHYINAQVSHNGDLAFTLDGKYNVADKVSPLFANIKIQSFSLPLLNPFIGQENAKLSGFIDGDIKVSGSPERIRLHGSIKPDAVFAYVPAVGEVFALESKPILFEENKVKLEQIHLRPVKQEKPLTIQGSFNLFEPQATYANIKIKGDEVTLLDSKRGKGQILYGKLIVSPDLTLKGKISSPTITGRIDLLGGTNATFVNKQSKLKAKNNMAGVVVFTDFADTLMVQQDAPALAFSSGANIALNVHIDPAVRLGVDLDEGHQDYATLQGGGDLRLSIPPYSEMSLIGNFDLTGGGEVRYEMPVVGRKVFTIDPESRITWTGDVLRPSINFKAINKVRAEVVENKQSRKVDFDVLIFAKETEEGYDIAFGLEAPNDFAIQNQLATMSEEERGKQAVALMVSGTFFAGEATEANMQKILSNLAVSELNNLTGKFLEGTDFNVGMELHDGTETGTVYTDYSYSFSKRLFNDRVRVVFGGRVAAGNLPSNYEQTFIDNVTLEYRLDKAGNQYVTLFHKRNNDNLFEGLVTETGVSYLLRKKLFKLSDLFKKEKTAKRSNSSPVDSIAIDADGLRLPSEEQEKSIEAPKEKRLAKADSIPMREKGKEDEEAKE